MVYGVPSLGVGEVGRDVLPYDRIALFVHDQHVDRACATDFRCGFGHLSGLTDSRRLFMGLRGDDCANTAHSRQRIPSRNPIPSPEMYHCSPSMNPTNSLTLRLKYSAPTTRTADSPTGILTSMPTFAMSV